MIRYIKFLFLISLNVAKPALGQTNIFDCDNSRKFATYLYNTNQYELAQHELERISFFCKNDSTTQLILLKSYRKLNHFQPANLYFELKPFAEINKLNPEYRQEYIRLLMSQQQYIKVQETIQQGLEIKDRFEYQLGTELLLSHWDKAYEMSQQANAIKNFKLNGLRSVAEKSYHSKRKKPWLATLMSIVIPGSGKVYSGYWGDGVISFLFTASSGYFAYRAFNKYGSDKVYPWIAGGLAVSYYAANIYGGNRAAIRFNDNLNHEFIHETEQVLFSDY
ncbi:MAG: hypothetical protein PF541_18095 [Prolixibacteraceae bacterium]|jgi:hypothetical protein|nr:hypothetical protein [Prolixibacteraceae bacterium]